MVITGPIRMPDRDLCADLRNDADAYLHDTENVCSASNRQLRIYVAGAMLGHDARAAYELYDGGGSALLDAPGRLTTAVIAAEVLRLMPANPEDDGR